MPTNCRCQKGACALKIWLCVFWCKPPLCILINANGVAIYKTDLISCFVFFTREVLPYPINLDKMGCAVLKETFPPKHHMPNAVLRGKVSGDTLRATALCRRNFVGLETRDERNDKVRRDGVHLWYWILLLPGISMQKSNLELMMHQVIWSLGEIPLQLLQSNHREPQQ
ncbi:unnamed protein product [Natator depressus]